MRFQSKILPVVEELVASHPRQTLFTRFIPAARLGGGPEMWARYYKCWAEVTLANIDPALVDLMPTLARIAEHCSQNADIGFSAGDHQRVDLRATGQRVEPPFRPGRIDMIWSGHAGYNKELMEHGSPALGLVA